MGSYTVGLDLGQVNDNSALAVVERVHVLPPGMGFAHWERHQDDEVSPQLTEELRVVHLQRWQLGSAYHVVVEDVCRLMRTPELEGALLSVDATGVGRGVMDMFRDAFMAGRMGAWPAQPVTITAGEQSHGAHVTKRDLLSSLLLPIQQGRLRIAAGLPLGEVLERELTSFRMKLSAAGRDSYEVTRREGEGHGDLVIAVALAARRPNVTAELELVEAD
jgi:hypothetical protein